MAKIFNIVGAGISGAVIARKLAEAGYKVHVFEKRDHIGGNMYDYKKDGVLVHKYGPHIFHTSKDNVIEFMSKFWELNDFQNVVEGIVDGKLVPIPFNFKSIDICFEQEADAIKTALKAEYPDQTSVTILELKKNENPLIKKLANFVYENVFLNYTTKMWDLKPTEIDESVTARIPVVLSYRNRYFNDKVEGLPKDSYTDVFKRIFDHPNIEVFLNADANSLISYEDNLMLFNGSYNPIVYSGPIDGLFSHKFGVLDYRSLHFEFQTLGQDKFQETAVVNYPADPTMTRITEYKNMTLQKVKDKTVISKEFPGTYSLKSDKWNEPYYPLATNSAREKYNKYANEAKKYKNLYLVGRMATYRYLNMDQAIEQALVLVEEIMANEF